MSIFKCKHKEVKIIMCNKDSKYYVVRCIKCREQWQEPKAIGEMYDTMHILKRG